MLIQLATYLFMVRPFQTVKGFITWKTKSTSAKEKILFGVYRNALKREYFAYTIYPSRKCNLKENRVQSLKKHIREKARDEILFGIPYQQFL